MAIIDASNPIGPIRPWGRYEVLYESETCKVKRIIVKPQQRLSYQYHFKRQEAWTIIQGTATITLNDEIKDYQTGSTALIPLKAKHRVENKDSKKDLIFIEVQTGSYFGEDDIIRIEDDYDRPEIFEVPDSTLFL